MEDALVVAMYLNLFVRNADIVKMANMAQLVNVIAPIFTTAAGIWFQTIFYPLEIFSNNCFGISLQTLVNCEIYKLNDDNIPYLDVSSVCNKEKSEIIVNVVNRHKEKLIVTDIINQSGIFKGTATVYEVNGKNIKDENSADKQLVRTIRKEISVNRVS